MFEHQSDGVPPGSVKGGMPEGKVTRMGEKQAKPVSENSHDENFIEQVEMVASEKET
jgi:hypothetical protein